MMKKQILMILAITAFSAQDALSSMNQRPRSSVYFGAQLGYGYSAAKAQSVLYDNTGGALGEEASDIAAGSFAGGVHLGYGYRLPSCVYLGAEFRYNAFSNSAQKQSKTTLAADQASSTIQVKNQGLADLSMLIGGYVCETALVYARLGVGFAAQQRLNVSGDFGTVNSKKTLTGFSAGLGIKVDVGSRFYVGFDYTLNTFGKNSANAVNDQKVVTNGVSAKNQFTHLILFSVGARLTCW